MNDGPTGAFLVVFPRRPTGAQRTANRRSANCEPPRQTDPQLGLPESEHDVYDALAMALDVVVPGLNSLLGRSALRFYLPSHNPRETGRQRPVIARENSRLAGEEAVHKKTPPIAMQRDGAGTEKRPM